MTDIAALLAAVEADPADTAPRLILADAVEDVAGPALGGLLRTREPMTFGDECPLAEWWRYNLPPGEFRVHPPSDLPDRVFGRLGSADMPHYCISQQYESRALAYAALARAVVRAATAQEQPV